MDRSSSLLRGYPALAKVVDLLNRHLENCHPTYFGRNPTHPYLSVKRSKVIHDNLWGTVRFSWRELALIDSPIMQRLRDVHQTGLAFHVYPSARHSRFEHCLGAASIASRVYDALLHKRRGVVRDIAKAIARNKESDTTILQFKQELRLAALLHDVGHSLFSHTSERVYGELSPLKEASKELTEIVGKEKGAGEVLSFCLTLTPSLSRLLDKAKDDLIGDKASDDYDGDINLENVALIIVGRSIHPYLQFLGDIVSSGFDADKLDYLLRDARAAGLPLNYDIDRYLYDIGIQQEALADDERQLEKLYSLIGQDTAKRKKDSAISRFEYYDTYRLRLSKRAINVIEQIVICKMMLFSYIYHHGKVRASEGLLERLLRRKLKDWREQGATDDEIVCRFIRMTDASLRDMAATEDPSTIVGDCAYRLVNRLLPREVFSISGSSVTHAPGHMVDAFLQDIHERKKRDKVLTLLQQAIGDEIVGARPDLGPDVTDALAITGIWVDAPKPPKFEDVDTMVRNPMNMQGGIAIKEVFPIHKWTEAYQHYRYQVRVFAFSEYLELARTAGEAAMKRVLGISSDEFYNSIRRDRQ